MNVVADTLSRLKFTPNTTKLNIAECFGYDEENLLPRSYSVQYYSITKDQKKDKDLLSKRNSYQDYEFIMFYGGNKTHEPVCHKGGIFLTQPLQKKTVELCHNTLCRPVETRR